MRIFSILAGGVELKATSGISLAIDPRFGAKISKPPKSFRPNIVCFSQFLDHHDSFIKMVSTLDSATVCIPTVSIHEARQLERLVRGINPNIRMDFCYDGKKLAYKGVAIDCFSYGIDGQLGYVVEFNKKSVVYVAGGSMTQMGSRPATMPVWEKLQKRKADLLLIGPSENLKMTARARRKTIQFCSAILPHEAALITSAIAPKGVVLISNADNFGVQNKSEYVLPASLIEEQFRWSIRHLCPKIKVLTLRANKR